MSTPCVFFDRDGIVNVAPPPEEYYVLSVERFFLHPEFLEALRIVRAKGYAAVIATNQKCVHKGLLSEEGLAEIHGKMGGALREAGLALDGIYSAIGGDDDPDRKPRPGLLLRAAADLDLDLERSWMIGDSERDIEAGQAAGCQETVLVNDVEKPSAADHRVPAMNALPGFLENALPAI